MRACMVAYTFYEGDNRVRRYGEALVRRGDEVDAFTLRQQGSPSTATVRGVTVHKIQKRIPNEKRSFDYLVRLLVFLVKSTVFLTRHHFRKKYDLIHVHSVPDFEVFAALIAKLTGAKVILDIHDAVPELYSGKFRVSRDSALFRLLVFAERLSGGFADHVIIANDIWRDRIALRSISPSKCSVILNYPDPDIFHRRVSTRKNLDKLVLLYPGTLSKHQGIATAIEAMGLLRSEIPNIEFHIYGSGTDEEWFREYAEKQQVEDIVYFNGVVPIEEVADAMAGADIGIEPKGGDSFSDEAFSTKIFEFMMVGVPVVASDTKVHRRYVDENSVRYFKVGDARDLANGVLALANDTERYDQSVARGYEVMNELSWENKKKKYFALADMLTNQPVPGARRKVRRAHA